MISGNLAEDENSLMEIMKKQKIMANIKQKAKKAKFDKKFEGTLRHFKKGSNSYKYLILRERF